MSFNRVCPFNFPFLNGSLLWCLRAGKIQPTNFAVAMVQKRDDGYGLFSCNKPDISLSLSVVPSQFNQMLPKGGFFSTHFHTVSKASWFYHVFPSICGSLFDSSVKYLFWVDKWKIGWLIQQRFPFQDSLGGTRWPIK